MKENDASTVDKSENVKNNTVEGNTLAQYDAREVLNSYNLTAKVHLEKFGGVEDRPFDCNSLDRFTAMLPIGSCIYEYGCSVGRITKYLSDKGNHKIIGLDFAENCISICRETFPEIEFVVDDMLDSKMPSNSADGIVAWLAIVNFPYSEVEQALKEWLRLLKPNSYCLFTFYVGEEFIKMVDHFGVSGANLTWHFMDTDKVLALAQKVGFETAETVVRYPYKYEPQAKRAYILLKKEGV